MPINKTTLPPVADFGLGNPAIGNYRTLLYSIPLKVYNCGRKMKGTRKGNGKQVPPQAFMINWPATSGRFFN